MIKVWYDRKRECYCTNAPILAAKKWGLPTPVAARILYEHTKEKLVASGLFENYEYEEPGKGVLWTLPL